MNKNRLIAIDLAKNVFQVCVMEKGAVVSNQAVKRRDLLLFMSQQAETTIYMEACYSSHYWAREFQSLGHQVFLIPAQHVKPFVRGNKNDRNDALAIAEASQRPNLSFVPTKTLEQQDLQMLHRIRERLVVQRTGLMNQTRGLLSEYGVIAPRGIKAFTALLPRCISDLDKQITPLLRDQLRRVLEEFQALSARIKDLNHQLETLARSNDLVRRLMSIPGIGYTIATALYSAIGSGHQFHHARELSVWLGVTPKQHASGTTNRLGGITKRGNRYLRKQVIHGARSALFRCTNQDDKMIAWARAVATRQGTNKAVVALANRMMRLVWTLLQTGQDYHRNHQVA